MCVDSSFPLLDALLDALVARLEWAQIKAAPSTAETNFDHPAGPVHSEHAAANAAGTQNHQTGSAIVSEQAPGKPKWTKSNKHVDWLPEKPQPIMPLLSTFFKRVFDGAPKPMNTLNQDVPSSRGLPQAPLASERVDHPARRQKLDSQKTFTDLQFQPAETEAEVRARRRNSISSTQSNAQGVGSTQSSNSRPLQGNVTEYRQLESQTKAPKRRRLRRRDSMGNSATHPETIEDSDDDPVHLVHTGSTFVRKEQEVDGRELSNRFVRSGQHANLGLLGRARAKRGATDDIVNDPKRVRNSSPDPLAEEPTSSSNRRQTRHTQSSPSESTRGEIKPTKFTSRAIPMAPTRRPGLKRVELPEMTVARHIVQAGFLLQAGVSGDYAYPDPKGSLYQKCFLQLHEVSTILHPTDEDGKLIVGLSFLAVDLKRVHTIKMGHPPVPIIAIHRAVNPGMTAPPKLHLEFSSQDEVEHFSSWVRMSREERLSVKMEIEIPDKLTRELNNLRSKASKGAVLRDSDASLPQFGDDIKLIERQRQMQSRKAKEPVRQTPPKSQRLSIKDSMERPPSRHEETIQVPESPKATQTRATRSRPSRPVERLETPPRGWTEDNPGWAGDWRNSLVYPAQGKDRATVDKEDIARLDEGQFLNDNLIIFVLRRLQIEMEKNQPELARRVHFHNTFFYDKLKPSKSGAGINYDSVKAWTSRVDLFTKDFIVVPINEYSHWYIAIIYNAPKLVPSHDSVSEPPEQQNPSSIAVVPVDLVDDGDMVASTDVGTTNASIPSADTDKHTLEKELRRMSISSCDDAKHGKKARELQAADENGVVDLMNGGQDHDQAQEQHQVQVRNGTTERKKQARKSNVGLRKADPSQPKIITLDSLGSPHSPACSYLRQYLMAELKDKKGVEIPDPGRIGMTAKNIPLQENYCDCGLYLLGYIHEFLQNPDGFIHGLLAQEEPQWKIDAPHLRQEIRQTIFELQKEQQRREDAERDEKRQRKRQAALDQRNLAERSSSSDANHPELKTQPSSSASAISLINNDNNTESGSSVIQSLERGEATDSSTLHQNEMRTIEAGKLGYARNTRHGSREVTPKFRAAIEDPGVNSLPGTFPSSPPRPTKDRAIIETPRRSQRSASNTTEREFLRPIPRSPSTRDGTPGNPVAVEESPEPHPSRDLTRDLQRDLRSATKELKGSKKPGNSVCNWYIPLSTSTSIQKDKSQPEARVARPNETATDSAYFRGPSRQRPQDRAGRAELVLKKPPTINIDDISD
ncbi:hypothetical protein JX265_003917 [Neoarthrinium moseri]|uniref:Ubiquitin-like protease family profile domain-containing protein n=1 Tax=Neoarthrinium moseri TaxID=1658444 RepID=A0A9P9WRH9_9PEZI|nr:hypothetical protein JX265_003917 [Neoarthrinium moseri]